jgi:hypothetical protein
LYDPGIESDPEAQPAFRTMDDGFVSRGYIDLGVTTTDTSSFEVEERVELYPYSPPPRDFIRWCRVKLTFYLLL